MTTDPTYYIDASVIRDAMRAKNRNSGRLASRAGVHYNSVRRILGEYKPKDMKPDRADKARMRTIRSLSFALGIPAADFVPELVEVSVA